MKNSILTILAVASLVACQKSETTAVDTTNDTAAIVVPADSPVVVNDSIHTNVMSADNKSLSDQDKKFADEAAKGGMMEVMLGELAKTNASHAKVKALGEMMVKDHSKANDELKSWASTVGYSLPGSLDTDKRTKYDDLKAKKGIDFDRAYTDLMVTDHKKDIADFKKEASEGMESSLKSFANKTIPTLEHHLTSSEDAKNTVK